MHQSKSYSITSDYPFPPSPRPSGNAFTATYRAQSFVGGGLDAHREVSRFEHVPIFSRIASMCGCNLWRFRDQRRIDVHRSGVLLCHEQRSLPKISRLLIPRIDSSVFGK